MPEFRPGLAVSLLLGAVLTACGTTANEACGPETCDGCCLPLGGCVAASEQSETACGSAGNACVSCLQGFTCTADGACAPPLCSGCITESGACLAVEEQSALQCGQGKACAPCVDGVACVDGHCGGVCKPTRRSGCR